MNASAPRLQTAVFGAGHLGTRHAERLAEAPGFNVAAVYDVDPGRSRAVADRVSCEVAASPEQALEGVDAVVVATSTTSHLEIAGLALASGKHVLVEKPLTGRVEDAEQLVRMATEAGLVLHVGHVERFNPALRGLLPTLPAPLFIESHRLAPLVPRNLDINVVQDLMIHDLDLAILLMGAEPVSVDAVGVPVLTDRVDIANARLRFRGGAVANLTASRVSMERVRKFRMFLPGTYVSADCAKRTSRVFRLKPGRETVLREAMETGGAVEMLSMLDHSVMGPDGADALSAEHDAFRQAVLGEPSEGVTGSEALRTLRTMVAVEHAINEGLRGV